MTEDGGQRTEDGGYSSSVLGLPSGNGETAMIKLSIVLALLGLALLLFSVVPRPAATSSAPAARPALEPTASAPVAAAPADVEYGKALFSAKGCAICHGHAAVPNSGFGPESDIPNLTKYRWEADYLRAWLKNPAAIRANTDMPNLGLKHDEIEALIAFLSAGASGG
jgi:cytochrome c2